MILLIEKDKGFVNSLSNKSKTSLMLSYEGLSGKRYELLVVLLDFNEERPLVMISAFVTRDDVRTLLHVAGEKLDSKDLATKLTINSLVSKEIVDGLSRIVVMKEDKTTTPIIEPVAKVTL